MKKLSAALVLLAALCSGAFAEKITVTDILGRKVGVEVPAQRVVLTFNFEEYVAATGAEGLNKVVGWARKYWEGRRQSTWDAFAARFPQIDSIADVGYIPKNTFNVEAVMTLAPDVVFAAKNDAKKIPDEVKRLAEAGIPVVFVDYHDQTVENHVASTLLFGRIMGQEARAHSLADWYQANVNKVYERAAKLTTHPRVYMEFSGDKSGPAAVGSSWGKLMWGAIIDRCGGTNIARDLVPGSDAPISREAVLASDPEVIIFAGNYRGDAALNVGLGYEAKEDRARSQLAGYMSRPWLGRPERGEEPPHGRAVSRPLAPHLRRRGHPVRRKDDPSRGFCRSRSPRDAGRILREIFPRAAHRHADGHAGKIRWITCSANTPGAAGADCCSWLLPRCLSHWPRYATSLPARPV